MADCAGRQPVAACQALAEAAGDARSAGDQTLVGPSHHGHCAGGGGIPVVERPDSSLAGVEAVIGKDLATSLLAQQLRADILLLLTDVDAIYIPQLGPGKPAGAAPARRPRIDTLCRPVPA